MSGFGGVPSPTGSANSSTLQPKELFAASGATSDSEATSPRSLWGSPSLAGPSGGSFTLFGAFGQGNGSGMSSPATSPTERVLAPGGEPSKSFSLQDDDDKGAVTLEDDDDESATRMLGQIDALWSSGGAEEAEAETAYARQQFIKTHQLDKLVATAVDRAMRHAVPNPVEYVAHELLRAAGKSGGGSGVPAGA